MTLSEKICTCRKKAGMSQEELAEKLDVSRQAISKWECGEAVPETAKLMGLAKALGVSVDWLLSEDDEYSGTEDAASDEERTEPQAGAASAGKTGGNTDWLERLPGFLRRMVMRWGWLAGIYVAAGGAGFIGVGALAKVLSASVINGFTSAGSSLMNGFGSFGGFGGREIQILDESGNPVTGEAAEAIRGALGEAGVFADPFGNFMSTADTMLANNPVSILANALIILGVLLLIAGIVLAVLLRKWGRKHGEG